MGNQVILTLLPLRDIPGPLTVVGRREFVNDPNSGDDLTVDFHRSNVETRTDYFVPQSCHSNGVCPNGFKIGERPTLVSIQVSGLDAPGQYTYFVAAYDSGNKLVGEAHEAYYIGQTRFGRQGQFLNSATPVGQPANGKLYLVLSGHYLPYEQFKVWVGSEAGGPGPLQNGAVLSTGSEDGQTAVLELPAPFNQIQRELPVDLVLLFSDGSTWSAARAAVLPVVTPFRTNPVSK
jgi:hypothetical protein